MIQDITPHSLCNAYHPQQPTADSRILAFRGNCVFLKYDGEITFLTFGQVRRADRYLFSVDGTAYFLAELPERFEWDGFAWHRMFAVRSMRPMAAVFSVVTARHLYMWYRDNRFCGRCGQPLAADERERMLACPACGNQVFPKIAPAVIVGLTDGDRILMTKYAGREYKRYALIAGFTEIGETAEQTVMREVFEEVGLTVKNIRYYKSQPWGFEEDLLLGFFCELAKPAPIRLQEEELACAEWVDYRDVPDDPEGLSLTREMMTYFKKQRTCAASARSPVSAS